MSLLRQCGQALPLGLAFILIGMLGGLVLFNTGQVAVDKQRLANASDSAAYSGMVWQARALNFQAYTNRAMVANQVSIGQAVSLHSWADYANQFGDNARAVLGGIPFVGQFVSAMATIIEIIANIARPIAQGMVSAIDPINSAVATAQKVMYASSFAATPDVVRNIAKASDARFTADTAYSALGLTQNLTGWRDFTTNYEEDDIANMQERTKVVNDSRDDFSKERYWDFFDSFWVYSTPFTKHKIFREGETRLVMVENNGSPTWEWMAKDTVGFHTRIYRGPFKSTKKVEVPMGWGAAYANSDGGGSEVLSRCRGIALQAEACRYRNRNSSTESLANSTIKSMSNYTGLNAFRSISETTRNPVDGEAVLRLKTEISMDIEDVQSSDRSIIDGEMFSAPMVSPAEKISSISVAEVYYRRPEAYKAGLSRAKRMEAANGYNPYWDVRLAPVELSDRLTALAMRGGMGDDSTPPGGATAEALANFEPPEPAQDGGAGGADGDERDVGAEVLAGDPALPSYAEATIASVMGATEAQATQIAALASNSPADFVASSIEGYIDADAIVDEIEDTIKDEVKNAARNFLEGAVNSYVDNQAPGVRNRIDQAQVLADEAIALADDLSQKFETMRTEVQREFQEALESRVVEFEAAMAPVVDEVNRLTPLYESARDRFRSIRERYEQIHDREWVYRPGVNAVHDELFERRNRLRVELTDFRAQAETLTTDLRNGLTTHLIDRIEFHGRGFLDERMPWNEMHEITNFLVDDYLLTPADLRGEIDVNEQLPWGQDEDV